MSIATVKMMLVTTLPLAFIDKVLESSKTIATEVRQFEHREKRRLTDFEVLALAWLRYPESFRLWPERAMLNAIRDAFQLRIDNGKFPENFEGDLGQIEEMCNIRLAESQLDAIRRLRELVGWRSH